MGVLEQTIPYTYATSGWKDRLVSYNGQAITYDALGNPTSYRGHTLVWGKVKQLEAYDTNSFTYNAEGIRTSKNGITYELDGTKILREVRPTGAIEYYYGSGGVVGFTYNGTQYYYQKNLQGDITAIYKASGNKVAEYVYDAWGKCTVVLDTDGIGTLNSYRYRGYYYDTEIGLYYTLGRYYDPETGRWINSDSAISGSGASVLGYNLFAYCHNNPISLVDKTGEWPDWNKLVQGALLATIGVLTVAAVVATGGTCLPAVAAAYAVVGTAGATAAVIGASEVAESFTGENVVRDFTGEGMYNTLKDGSVAVISLSPTVLEVGSAMSVCFVEGTPILAEEGHVAIESIEVGDYVWAEDPETGEKALKQVVNTFRNSTEELVKVYIDDEEITTTPEHPFYVLGKGWTSAGRLRKGDTLVTQSGKHIRVEDIQYEKLDAPITVYNFEVEDFHTYFVGAGLILVHNQCAHSYSTGFNNKRILQSTKIKKYTVTMDLEAGGSGILNIHLEVDGKKYIYKDGNFFDMAGNILKNKVLKNNRTIQEALKKALNLISQGWNGQ